MDFISQHQERGFFHQSTDLEALTELTKNNKIAAYIGFDCTASSLHVGNLMQIMILRLLQKTGHKPIVLVGGGTTKIGDPSGKDETRKMLTEEQINANMEGIKNNLQKFIKFGDGASDAVLVNNNDWLSSLGYIEFLSNYGRLFSINRMLTFDSVKLRLEREQNLTFLEFNYMLLQSYDFVELNRKHKCVLQLGGSDQWGNIVSGVELGRKLGISNLYGLTSPLITTSSGAKMGKSVSGAIWLSEDMLSPYDYYQFWRNTEDNDVIRFMKLYTELPMAKINEFEKLEGSEINEAKKILAFEATKLCHGEEKAKIAEDTARSLFEQNKLSDNLPTIYLESQEFANGKPAFELLVAANLAESNGEARRLIRGNGAKINDIAIIGETDNITLSDFQDGVIKLSAGKKKHALVKLK